jgi:hypothetical protein
MRIRAIFSAALCLAAFPAAANDEAVITFSGKGKQPIEVRDSSGEVTELIGQRSLTLNTIPRDAAAREQAYRESQIERAAELTAEEKAAERAEAERQAEAAKAAEEAAAQAAAEAKAAEEEYNPTPRKVRRKTVRGTRYIPMDSPAAETQSSSSVQPPATSTRQPSPPPPRRAQPRRP